MTDTPPPLADAELANIRARFEGTAHPGWRDVADVGRLLAEIGRLRSALANLSAELDTITAVARSNAAAQRVAVEECERLRAELAEAVQLSHHYRTLAESAELLPAARTSTAEDPMTSTPPTDDADDADLDERAQRLRAELAAARIDIDRAGRRADRALRTGDDPEPHRATQRAAQHRLHDITNQLEALRHERAERSAARNKERTA